jgi:hypothetical protein
MALPRVTNIRISDLINMLKRYQSEGAKFCNIVIRESDNNALFSMVEKIDEPNNSKKLNAPEDTISEQIAFMNSKSNKGKIQNHE